MTARLFSAWTSITCPLLSRTGYLRPIIRRPSGEMFAWHESLDRGELWAARHCRRLALVARAQPCEDNVLIRCEHTVALAELVIADETAATRQVEDMEAGNIKDRLPLPESPDPLASALFAIEAAAWRERGIFESDLSAARDHTPTSSFEKNQRKSIFEADRPGPED
jgi:hypothetical protein